MTQEKKSFWLGCLTLAVAVIIHSILILSLGVAIVSGVCFLLAWWHRNERLSFISDYKWAADLNDREAKYLHIKFKTLFDFLEPYFLQEFEPFRLDKNIDAQKWLVSIWNSDRFQKSSRQIKRAFIMMAYFFVAHTAHSTVVCLHNKIIDARNKDLDCETKIPLVEKLIDSELKSMKIPRPKFGCKESLF